MKCDKEKMLNINTHFHQLIYSASHNRMLSHMLASYQIYIKHIRTTPKNDDEYLRIVFDEHRAIFNAIKARDAEAGARAMEVHMDNSKARSLPQK